MCSKATNNWFFYSQPELLFERIDRHNADISAPWRAAGLPVLRTESCANTRTADRMTCAEGSISAYHPHNWNKERFVVFEPKNSATHGSFLIFRFLSTRSQSPVNPYTLDDKAICATPLKYFTIIPCGKTNNYFDLK